MRSYGQFCGLAKSLDVIGDRWTLLIVRELLIRGPSRYTDLRIGLPGIPTNLLAERLRDMEEAGLLRRDMSPAPAAAAVYGRSEEHTSELQSRSDLVCRLLLEKKKNADTARPFR